MSIIDSTHPSPVRPRAGTRSSRAARGVPTVVALTALTAAIVNTLIWAVGALAGGSFEYTDAGQVLDAAPGGLAIASVLPLTIGMTVTAVIAHWWRPIIRVAQVVGSALALVTIGGTISADFDTASTIALSLAHVALVPIFVTGLEVIRRRQPLVG